MKLKELNDFVPFCLFLVFWSNSHRGCLLDGALIREGHLIQQKASVQKKHLNVVQN